VPLKSVTYAYEPETAIPYAFGVAPDVVAGAHASAPVPTPVHAVTAPAMSITYAYLGAGVGAGDGASPCEGAFTVVAHVGTCRKVHWAREPHDASGRRRVRRRRHTTVAARGINPAERIYGLLCSVDRQSKHADAV